MKELIENNIIIRINLYEKNDNNISKIKMKSILKGILNIIYVLLIIGGIVWLFYYFGSNAKILPPTSMNGHIEENPKSHILDDEMPEKIQRHMFEHADGTGDPGIIIQYNCVKFECEKDLVGKLKNIVEGFPHNVYLAPNSKYDGKIILTAEGRIKVLDEFNESVINDFIILK